MTSLPSNSSSVELRENNRRWHCKGSRANAPTCYWVARNIITGPAVTSFEGELPLELALGLKLDEGKSLFEFTFQNCATVLF